MLSLRQNKDHSLYTHERHFTSTEGASLLPCMEQVECKKKGKMGTEGVTLTDRRKTNEVVSVHGPLFKYAGGG